MEEKAVTFSLKKGNSKKDNGIPTIDIAFDGEKPPMGQSVKMFSSMDDAIPQSVSSCSAAHLNIRSKDYLNTALKVPSSEAILKLHAVDMYHSKRKLKNIMQHLEFPRDLPDFKRDSIEAGRVPSSATPDKSQTDFYCPKLFVMNFIFPRYAPSMLSNREDGPSTHLVMSFYVDEECYNHLKNETTEGYRLFKRYLQVDPESEENSAFLAQMKCVPKFLNQELIDLGILRPLVNSYNGKPFLTGPKGHSFVKTDDYFECDIDIHTYNYVARSSFYSLYDKIKLGHMMMGFVIEGREDDDLPEQVIGCVMANRVDPYSGMRIELPDDDLESSKSLSKTVSKTGSKTASTSRN